MQGIYNFIAQPVCTYMYVGGQYWLVSEVGMVVIELVEKLLDHMYMQELASPFNILAGGDTYPGPAAMAMSYYTVYTTVAACGSPGILSRSIYSLAN